MANEKCPVLAGAIPAFEAFMTRLERYKKKPELSPAAQAGLDIAIKYYQKMDNTDAYAFAMCKYFAPPLDLQTYLTFYQSFTQVFECTISRRTGMNVTSTR
jgi:hypothetical protein